MPARQDATHHQGTFRAERIQSFAPARHAGPGNGPSAPSLRLPRPGVAGLAGARHCLPADRERCHTGTLLPARWGFSNTGKAPSVAASARRPLPRRRRARTRPPAHPGLTDVDAGDGHGEARPLWQRERERVCVSGRRQTWRGANCGGALPPPSSDALTLPEQSCKLVWGIRQPETPHAGRHARPPLLWLVFRSCGARSLHVQTQKVRPRVVPRGVKVLPGSTHLRQVHAGHDEALCPV